MRVCKVLNQDLLNIIIRKEELTYDELKDEFCEPTTPGVVLGKNVMFDSYLKVLEEEGYIKITNGLISYIKHS